MSRVQPPPHSFSVLIDATAVPADRRGVGRYVDELVTAIDTEFSIACQASDAEHYRRIAPRARVLPQRGIRRAWVRLLWEQVVLPTVARRAGVRVIHSPHYTLPLLTLRKRVVTFHDATFFSDPEVHTRFKGVFFRSWIRVSRRLADAIIVPSRATASELERFVSTPRGRAPYRVIYHGVDRETFRPPAPAEVVAMRHALGLDESPWIAFLGTLEPRKNLPALITAYAELVTSWDAAWGAVPVLSLAGGAGWATELGPLIKAVQAPGSVRQLGYIELDLVPAYLGGSLIVAYPSLGEGFGLPVLEAMACRATVLTTRRLALPEVGGDAVAYSEPDPDALSAALRHLAGNPAERERLAALGLARSAKFTWAASADAHLALFAAV